VEFPAPPEEKAILNQSQAWMAFAGGQADPQVKYMVIWQTLPKSVTTTAAARDYLDGAEEGFTEKSGAKARVQREHTEFGMAARDLTVDDFQRLKARIRVLVGGRQTYQLLVLAENEDELTSAEAERFFLSFQVLMPPPPLHAGADRDSAAFQLGRLIADVCMGFALVAGIVGVIIYYQRKRKRALPARPGDSA
jgi:hypothetical protein